LRVCSAVACGNGTRGNSHELWWTLRLLEPRQQLLPREHLGILSWRW
jgi:hypothetical protein